MNHVYIRISFWYWHLMCVHPIFILALHTGSKILGEIRLTEKESFYYPPECCYHVGSIGSSQCE